eukprot:9233542-Alexandrium_andersonii.AAC.1
MVSVAYRNGADASSHGRGGATGMHREIVDPTKAGGPRGGSTAGPLTSLYWKDPLLTTRWVKLLTV